MTEAEFIVAAAEALRKAATPQQAARRIYAICCEAAKAWGMKPEIECKMEAPRAKKGGKGPHPYVNFEAGPYDWAVEVSMISGGKVWAEPYYGFDLYFYAKEDARS